MAEPMTLSDHVQTVDQALPGDVGTQYAWNKVLGELDAGLDALAELDQLRECLADLRFRLAEHERTQATGGPPPPETRGWGNEQHVPPPESAARADMAPPARYGASNQERSKP